MAEWLALSTAGETVGPTDYCDNTVVDSTGAKCIALFFSGSSHVSAGEMVDICMCVDVTLILRIMEERVHLRNTHTCLRSANEGNTDMGVP